MSQISLRDLCSLLTFTAKARLLQEREGPGETRGGQDGTGAALSLVGISSLAAGVYLQEFHVSTHLSSTYYVPGPGGLQREKPPARQGALHLASHMPNKTPGRSEGQQERLGPRPVPLFPRELEVFLVEVALSWALKTGNRAFQ